MFGVIHNLVYLLFQQIVPDLNQICNYFRLFYLGNVLVQLLMFKHQCSLLLILLVL